MQPHRQVLCAEIDDYNRKHKNRNGHDELRNQSTTTMSLGGLAGWALPW
jgi:hypothetical protein